MLREDSIYFKVLFVHKYLKEMRIVASDLFYCCEARAEILVQKLTEFGNFKVCLVRMFKGPNSQTRL